MNLPTRLKPCPRPRLDPASEYTPPQNPGRLTRWLAPGWFTQGPPKTVALRAQIAQFGVYPCRTDLNDFGTQSGGSGAAETSIQSHSVTKLADSRQFLMTRQQRCASAGCPGLSGRGFADGVRAGG